MTFSLAQQTVVFLEAIMLGVIGGFIYDICRAFRKEAHLKTIGTVIADAVFWFFMLTSLFYFAVTDAVSQMRGYVLIGEACGIALYFLSFSVFLFSFLCFIIKKFIFIIHLPILIVKILFPKISLLLANVKKHTQFIEKIKKRLSFLRKTG